MSQSSVLTLGVGAFAHSVCKILADRGALVATYLTRPYGHYPPSLVGPTFGHASSPPLADLLRDLAVDLVVPQSIDWARAPWANDLLRSGVGVFSPTGEGMRIERERDFARALCQRYRIPFPKSYVADSQHAAEAMVRAEGLPFVIKNPLCSPGSPIHTIVCETVDETCAWLSRVNFQEGAFLQEYVGRAEAGHIAFVSAGEIFPIVTNQEYKRAFAGNTGIVAGAPLGGIVERDERDKYGLCHELLFPLLPWFRSVNYHGPIQVTAARHDGRWKVLEYNIRIGVTSGAMLLRMMSNPTEVIRAVTRNEPPAPQWRPHMRFGCSVTLAGYGYPFTQIEGPPMPIEHAAVADGSTCDLWWNEVSLDAAGKLNAVGHRLADAIGYADDLPEAITRAYGILRKIRSAGSYYRNDVGASLWPPGNV